MPAPGSPPRVPHKGREHLSRSVAICRSGRDGEGSPCPAELRARQGRGGRSGSTRICGISRLDEPFGGDACAGARLRVSCSSGAFPPRKPHDQLASCWWRQWRWGHCPQVGTKPRVPGLCVRGRAGHWSSHTRGCRESHQHAWKLGLIFINIPGLRLDLEPSCMDGHGKASSCVWARFVRLSIPIPASSWGQDRRRQRGGKAWSHSYSWWDLKKHPQSIPNPRGYRWGNAPPLPPTHRGCSTFSTA